LLLADLWGFRVTGSKTTGLVEIKGSVLVLVSILNYHNKLPGITSLVNGFIH